MGWGEKKETPVGADGLPEVYFDYSFVELFKSSHDRIVKGITTIEPKGGSPKRKVPVVEEAEMRSYKDTIATQEVELAALRDKIPGLEEKALEAERHESELILLQAKVSMLEVQMSEQTAAHTKQVDFFQRTIQNMELALTEANSKYETLQNDHEDLLVYLADQDEQMELLRQRLESHGIQEDQIINRQSEDDHVTAEESQEQTGGSEQLREQSYEKSDAAALFPGSGSVEQSYANSEATGMFPGTEPSLVHQTYSKNEANAHFPGPPSQTLSNGDTAMLFQTREQPYGNSDTASLFTTTNGAYDSFL